jgi:hypothetical protein
VKRDVQGKVFRDGRSYLDVQVEKKGYMYETDSLVGSVVLVGRESSGNTALLDMSHQGVRALQYGDRLFTPLFSCVLWLSHAVVLQMFVSCASEVNQYFYWSEHIFAFL